MEALNVLVKMLDETKISHLQQTFEEIDTDRTGMITFDELQKAFDSHADSLTNMPKSRLKQIMKNVDY